jgi:hypothetical protein
MPLARLAAQADLAPAESAVINFRLNQIALLRSMGTLLEERGIVVQ